MEAAPAATRDRTGGADELHPWRLAWYACAVPAFTLPLPFPRPCCTTATPQDPVTLRAAHAAIPDKLASGCRNSSVHRRRRVGRTVALCRLRALQSAPLEAMAITAESPHAKVRDAQAGAGYSSVANSSVWSSWLKGAAAAQPAAVVPSASVARMLLRPRVRRARLTLCCCSGRPLPLRASHFRQG